MAFSSLIILSVILSTSVCISAFGPSSSPSSSLVILLIHSALLLCLSVAIFLSKIVGSLLHPVVVIFYCHLLPIVDRIFFHCFGMSCFVCIVLPFVDIFFNRHSFASTFWFISSSFSCVVFSFLFLIIPASFFCFIIFACFCRCFI